MLCTDYVYPDELRSISHNHSVRSEEEEVLRSGAGGDEEEVTNEPSSQAAFRAGRALAKEDKSVRRSLATLRSEEVED